MIADVLPDLMSGTGSFLNDEIEYLEFENLVEEVADRLDATWSYNLNDEAYQIEFIDEEGTLHEAISVSSEFCEEGFNEGRDLLICRVYLLDCPPEDSEVLFDILQLAEELIFSKVYINADNQAYLEGKALFHQESASDVITTMVEEMSTLASEFRLKLEA